MKPQTVKINEIYGKNFHTAPKKSENQKFNPVENDKQNLILSHMMTEFSTLQITQNV
jgi:hypothetical protein